MASTSNAVFNTLVKEDKFDGTNYSLWSFMVQEILVFRYFYSHVTGGDDVRPGNVAPATPGRAPSTLPPPKIDQKRWNSKDALSLLVANSLTCKRSIIPRIKSCRHAKDAWDILETLNSAKNDTKITYLKKQKEDGRGWLNE